MTKFSDYSRQKGLQRYRQQIARFNTRRTRLALTAMSALSARTSSCGGEGSLFFLLGVLVPDGGTGDEAMSDGVRGGVSPRSESISSSLLGGEERGEDEADMFATDGVDRDFSLMLVLSVEGVRSVGGNEG